MSNKKRHGDVKWLFMPNALREYMKPLIRREVWDSGPPAVPDKIDTPRRIMLSHTGAIIGTAPSSIKQLDLYRVIPYLQSSLYPDRQSRHHILITVSGLVVEMQSGTFDAMLHYMAPTVPSRPYGMGVYRVDVILEGDILRSWPNKEQESALSSVLALYALISPHRWLNLPIYIDPALKPDKYAAEDSLASSIDKLREMVASKLERYRNYTEIGNEQIIGTI
jgi:hypothetical protein